MILGLTLTCVALLGATVALLALWVRSQSALAQLRGELTRFSDITDLEKHADEQRQKASAALAEVANAQSELRGLTGELDSHRGAVASQQAQVDKLKGAANRYNQVLGMFKTAEDLKAHIRELQGVLGGAKTIAEVQTRLQGQRAEVERLQAHAAELKGVLDGAKTITEVQTRLQGQRAEVERLQAQAAELEEALEMQEFGFYRPRFEFETSSIYQQRIDEICRQQKRVVKDNSAVRWDKVWSVEGSDAKGRKMMAEQTTLLLRAFNGECDAAIAKVKYSNAVTLENRIVRAHTAINRLARTNTASITDRFLQLKLDELHLVHEYQVKRQREREEEREIKERMREEARALREIAEAEEEAEKEAKDVSRALERARQTFELATRNQIALTEEARANNAALATQVAKLEKELKDAIDRKAKAIARAQLTKSGNLYVLSNIGSFGDNMYKIGMTRRFEPLVRVKELGDASVPFPFDVHAVIYCENAPALECKLHQHFADRRVNLVNLRREYFRVTLEEIIAAVGKYHGEITFVKAPEAAEYRETLAKLKADGLHPAPQRTAPLQPEGQAAITTAADSTLAGIA